MNSKDRELTIINEDGTEQVCEILFTHYSEEFKKHYVVFNPKNTEELVPSVYNPDEENGTLKPIDTDEELNMLQELLENYMDEIDE